MRGTRIRWDGALKALGIGVAGLVALIALPGLLAGEPPPPPDDVGLVPQPPPASPAPAPSAPPAPTPPIPPRPKPPEQEPSKPKPPKRSLGDDDGARRNGIGDGDRGERAGADPGAPAVAVVAPPSQAPPAPVTESFGFER